MNELIHLKYDMMYGLSGDGKLPIDHPQKVIKELGIKYQIAVPQSVYDCWQFWNCSNVPEKLPPYITIHKWNPREWIGYGLSEQQALYIEEKTII